MERGGKCTIKIILFCEGCLYDYQERFMTIISANNKMIKVLINLFEVLHFVGISLDKVLRVFVHLKREVMGNCHKVIR